MTLDEAKKIQESLEELSVNEEEFSWGPTYEFAQERKREALRIIRREIKQLKNDPTAELTNRITEYLSRGGLFNPEIMEHDKVRDLLIDIRDYLNERTN